MVFDSFQIYGGTKLARFVEDILMKNSEKELVITHEDKRKTLLDTEQYWKWVERQKLR